VGIGLAKSEQFTSSMPLLSLSPAKLYRQPRYQR
jgi:hypothetical protein